MAGKTPIRISMFGEGKVLAEWARDPRCKVSYEALRNRLKSGMAPEKALTEGSHAGRKPVSDARAAAGRSYKERFEAFGESKTIIQWCKDPKCKVSRPTLLRRLASGVSIEEALTSEPLARSQRGKVGGDLIEGFGESKSLADWGRDPRCEIGPGAVSRRLRVGVPLEAALRLKLKRPTPSRLYFAFGEAKTIIEWSENSRCVVSKTVLRERLRKGIEVEQAITTPRLPAAPRAKPIPTFFAFGEKKTLEEWTADSRCSVKEETIRKRIREGWSSEQAIVAPKQWKQPTPKGYAAFGETKPLKEWARDIRCIVGYQIVRKRLKGGIPLEEAMTVKKFPYVDPRTIPLTAFGETKSIRGWARDPRCLVAYSTFIRRLHLGDQLEDALRGPDNEVFRPLWNEVRYPVDDDVIVS